jgi:hypothetical protein
MDNRTTTNAPTLDNLRTLSHYTGAVIVAGG